jgi:HK97 family phage prohead protease
MTREFKHFAADEYSERGTFSGWASRYNEIDSYDDMVMPGAYDDTVRELGGQVVILSDHDVTKSIGMARMSLRPEGLWVDAKISLELQDGRDAYIRMRDLGKSGLSIGYDAINKRTRNGVRELTKIKLYEVSVVQIPALDSARIASVKSNYDDAALALASLSESVRDTTASLKASHIKSKMQQVADLVRQGRKHMAASLMIEVEREIRELKDLAA